MILVFSPPPLPSSLPNFPISSSPTPSSVPGEHDHIPSTEGPLVRDKAVDSRHVVLPSLGSNDTLPVSADSSNRSPPASVPSLSNRAGVVYPWRAPLTGAFSYHELAVGSSLQYDARAKQDRTSPDTSSTAPMSTSGAHIAITPSTTELASNDGIVDTSTTTSTFVAQANSWTAVATGVEQTLNASVHTERIADQSTDTATSLHTHDPLLHQGTPCPTSEILQCSPGSQFASFASDLVSSGNRDQVPTAPFSHFAGSMALPVLESNGTLPTFADSSSSIPSPLGRFDGSGVAHPWCSPPSGAVVYHDPTIAFSQCDAPAYQPYMSLDARYAALVSTAAKIRDDARHATQLVGSRAIADSDASTSEPAFTGEANWRVHLPATGERGLNAPNGNGHPIHVDSHVSEGLLPTYGLLPSQGTPYPTLDTPRDAPTPGYPPATFVNPESMNDRVPSPFSHFARRGVADAQYGAQEAADLHASEIGAPMTLLVATPVLAPTHHGPSYVPDYVPLANGYVTSLCGSPGYEREGVVISPLPSPIPRSLRYHRTLLHSPRTQP